MNSRMLLCFLFAFAATIVLGQTDPSRSSAQPPTSTPDTRATHDRSMQMMGSSADMDNMVRSVTSAADMCRTMMERQMKMMPIFATVGAIFGLLVTIALVLFVVLEIRLIKYLGLRLQYEGAS